MANWTDGDISQMRKDLYQNDRVLEGQIHEGCNTMKTEIYRLERMIRVLQGSVQMAVTRLDGIDREIQRLDKRIDNWRAGNCAPTSSQDCTPSTTVSSCDCAGFSSGNRVTIPTSGSSSCGCS